MLTLFFSYPAALDEFLWSIDFDPEWGNLSLFLKLSDHCLVWEHKILIMHWFNFQNI